MSSEIRADGQYPELSLVEKNFLRILYFVSMVSLLAGITIDQLVDTRPFDLWYVGTGSISFSGSQVLLFASHEGDVEANYIGQLDDSVVIGPGIFSPDQVIVEHGFPDSIIKIYNEATHPLQGKQVSRSEVIDSSSERVFTVFHNRKTNTSQVVDADTKETLFIYPANLLVISSDEKYLYGWSSDNEGESYVILNLDGSLIKKVSIPDDYIYHDKDTTQEFFYFMYNPENVASNTALSFVVLNKAGEIVTRDQVQRYTIPNVYNILGYTRVLSEQYIVTEDALIPPQGSRVGSAFMVIDTINQTFNTYPLTGTLKWWHEIYPGEIAYGMADDPARIYVLNLHTQRTDSVKLDKQIKDIHDYIDGFKYNKPHDSHQIGIKMMLYGGAGLGTGVAYHGYARRKRKK